MTMQWRRTTPRAGQRDPMYSPERDFGVIGPDLVRAAVAALDERFWEPWFKEYMADFGLTYDDVVAAAKTYAGGINRIIVAKDPVVALKESGFSELPPPLQAAFYIKLGQVMLATVWKGVKELSRPESDPPEPISAMLEEIDGQFQKLIGAVDDNVSQVANRVADTDIDGLAS